jgi:hypothetical protein
VSTKPLLSQPGSSVPHRNPFHGRLSIAHRPAATSPGLRNVCAYIPSYLFLKIRRHRIHSFAQFAVPPITGGNSKLGGHCLSGSCDPFEQPTEFSRLSSTTDRPENVDPCRVPNAQVPMLDPISGDLNASFESKQSSARPRDKFAQAGRCLLAVEAARSHIDGECLPGVCIESLVRQ